MRKVERDDRAVNESTEVLSTRQLRESDGLLYAGLRDLLVGRGVDPTSCVVADLFPDDGHMEQGPPRGGGSSRVRVRAALRRRRPQQPGPDCLPLELERNQRRLGAVHRALRSRTHRACSTPDLAGTRRRGCDGSWFRDPGAWLRMGSRRSPASVSALRRRRPDTSLRSSTWIGPRPPSRPGRAGARPPRRRLVT